MTKTIEEKLKNDFKKALLAGRKQEAEALSYLISILQKQAARNPTGKLTEDQAQNLLQKELKTKKEALELFKKGNRQDLVEKEEFEIKLLEKYLPEMMSPEQIKEIIEKIAAKETEFGKIMGAVMAEIKGRTPGDLVAKLVREVLKLGK